MGILKINGVNLMGLTKNELGDLSLYLQQLPDIADVRKLTAQESVRALSKDISALQKRGYTFSQIADALRTGGGLTIAPQTLKSYMQRVRKVAIKKVTTTQRSAKRLESAPTLIDRS